jgi:hypothetical protein
VGVKVAAGVPWSVTLRAFRNLLNEILTAFNFSFLCVRAASAACSGKSKRSEECNTQ